MPTRQECIQAAGEVYGAILANPDRRAALLAHREAVAAQQAADAATKTTARPVDARGRGSVGQRTTTGRKSA